MLLATVAATDAWTPFLLGAFVLAVGMLIWDTVEVGRNDAANLVNAVFGARILTRRMAVRAAGIGVILGAAAASPVIETARKGIFDPTMLTMEKALAVYTAVYIVDTVLLYGYSAFGMPVSTTACLVFELLGASFAMRGPDIINWDKAGTVVFAIVCSIAISGAAGFLIQRAVRGVFRDRGQDLTTLLAHGGWAGGAMLAGLCYFMVTKGMKHVGFVKSINKEVMEVYGEMVVVMAMWVLFAFLVHAVLIVFRERAARWLFPVLAITGTVSMGFAFGQNDLANCASPGLAALYLIDNRHAGVAGATEVPIRAWQLLGCGVLLFVGMTTMNAQRVTRAAAHTGSMAHHVRLWAPNWCVAVARVLLRFRRRAPSLAPAATFTGAGKAVHYDALRACVILSVSASIIATASSFGLPVSTTYVVFAAVVATGMADRILQRGDAALKLGRTIWVVFSWFAAAVIAAVAGGLVCRLIFHLNWPGMLVGVGANMAVRFLLKKRADAQEERVREEARERMNPELFASEFEG